MASRTRLKRGAVTHPSLLLLALLTAAVFDVVGARECNKCTCPDGPERKLGRCAQTLTVHPFAQEKFYGIDGTCFACPGVSFSLPKSTTISNCSCPTKTYGVDGECATCPGISRSKKGSKTIAACLCPAMFYGVDGECLSCPGISLSKKRSTTLSNCTCP
ncbi:hypothetical protein T484DRAFT_1851321, partial [Baffinella frigidus]